MLYCGNADAEISNRSSRVRKKGDMELGDGQLGGVYHADMGTWVPCSAHM